MLLNKVPVRFSLKRAKRKKKKKLVNVGKVVETGKENDRIDLHRETGQTSMGEKPNFCIIIILIIIIMMIINIGVYRAATKGVS